MAAFFCFLRKKCPFLLITLPIIFSFPSLAQEKKHYIVRPGDIIIERIPEEGRYRFDDFRNARVFFVNNSSASGLMNYHLLYGEMQFVDSSGDTLSLANESLLRKVSFESTDYYYDSENKRYLELLAGGDQLKLTRHLMMRLLEHDVKSMDGYVSTLDPNMSRVVYDLDNRVHETTLLKFFESRAQHPMLFSPHEEYYFVDKNNIVWPVKKSSLRRIFPDHRRALGDFLSEEKTNFSRKADLEKLVNFCNRL